MDILKAFIIFPNIIMDKKAINDLDIAMEILILRNIKNIYYKSSRWLFNPFNGIIILL